MRTAASIALVCCALTSAAQTLDRIAVSVDKQVITESTLVLDRRVTAFLDGVPVDLSGPAKRMSAERLIDQLLILREAKDSHLPLPTEKNAAVLLSQVKAQEGSDATYQADLKRYEITEADLSEHLLAGLVALTFSDLRFRPSVQISDDDVRAFYSTVQDGQVIEAPRSDIEEILIRQRTSDALDAWLKSARMAAHIQYRENVFR
ncbi:MAG: hypothetical protein WDO18_09330 [Acidobacteriota bacterium]